MRVVPFPSRRCLLLEMHTAFGARRVALSQAEQARLDGGHIVALVPWRWQDLRLGLGSPLPCLFPCPIRFRASYPKSFKAEMTDGGPQLTHILASVHGSCWALRVVKW